MRRMKLRMGCCGVLSAMALVFALSAMFSLASAEDGVGVTAAMAAETSPEQYLLTAYGDFVGVYDLTYTPPQLLMVTEIRLDGLRRQDQAALQAGITAPDREALLLLLEDFGS